jgi:hypothetical protein
MWGLTFSLNLNYFPKTLISPKQFYGFQFQYSSLQSLNTTWTLNTTGPLQNATATVLSVASHTFILLSLSPTFLRVWWECNKRNCVLDTQQVNLLGNARDKKESQQCHKETQSTKGGSEWDSKHSLLSEHCLESANESLLFHLKICLIQSSSSYTNLNPT